MHHERNTSVRLWWDYNRPSITGNCVHVVPTSLLQLSQRNWRRYTALDAAFQLRHVLVAQAAVHVDVIVVQ